MLENFVRLADVHRNLSNQKEAGPLAQQLHVYTDLCVRALANEAIAYRRKQQARSRKGDQSYQQAVEIHRNMMAVVDRLDEMMSKPKDQPTA